MVDLPYPDPWGAGQQLGSNVGSTPPKIRKKGLDSREPELTLGGPSAAKLNKRLDSVLVLTKTSPRGAGGGLNQDFAAPAGSNQDFENQLFGCPLGRSDVPLQQFFRWQFRRGAGKHKIQLPPHDELARYPALRTPAALRRRPRHARRRFRAAHLVVVTVYAHAPAPRRTRTKFAGRKTADGARNLGEKERALFNARDRFT